jgi:uncharacterized protein YhbP (UPF0306 family)
MKHPHAHTPIQLQTMSDLKAAIYKFLAAHSTLTLATVSAEGQPMAASLFYAQDDELRLYWLSDPKSRHSLNLNHTVQAAVTVHNETWVWPEIAGVQMEGEVKVVQPGADWQAVWELYLAKFPFVGEFQAEVSRSDFYRLLPRWARLIDNRKGFGYKEEILLAPA